MAGKDIVQAGLVLRPVWRDSRRPLAWMDDALCVQGTPELWFPDNGNVAEPKRICGRCPVRDQCSSRIDVLEKDEPGRDLYGTFAGRPAKVRIRARGPVTGKPQRDDRIVHLSGQGWDAPRIADEVGCDERTVYRVLARAREAS